MSSRAAESFTSGATNWPMAAGGVPGGMSSDWIDRIWLAPRRRGSAPGAVDGEFGATDEGGLDRETGGFDGAAGCSVGPGCRGPPAPPFEIVELARQIECDKRAARPLQTFATRCRQRPREVPRCRADARPPEVGIVGVVEHQTPDPEPPVIITRSPCPSTNTSV